MEQKAPKTVFEIEREARWRMWWMFALLAACVYVAVYLALLFLHYAVNGVVVTVGALAWVPTVRGALLVLAGALAFSLFYWYVSRIGAKERLMRAMVARPLDPDDRFHQRLANVVEEMRLATGDRRIECVVVPTVGMNAFAFSDLRTTHVVGVTEGALSRLSRQQLEAVVAHEFAHILSGDCATATVSCLLFGIYSTLSDRLLEVIVGGAQVRSPLAVMGAGGLWLILGVLRIASAVTNAAISRQREWAADMAAVRFTRDPLSLAQALHMMRRHPGGAGYIPSGLSPLCIRATHFSPGQRFARALATHPQVESRILRLLMVAHVDWEDFEAQAAKAEEYFDGREHVEAAPGQSKLGTRDVGAAAAGLAAPLAAAIAPLAMTAAPARTAASGGAGWVPRTGTAAASAGASAMCCPSCRDPLVPVDYEGVSIHACRACAGRLVGADRAQRIVTRRQVKFTEEQERLADLLYRQGDVLRRRAVLSRRAAQSDPVACPRCGRAMMRGHYTYQYAVEVDRCVVCELIWFETNELEVLQILVERQTG